MAFIRFPFQLYRNDPCWIPPLIHEQKRFFDPACNPYLQHSEVQPFLAYQDGKVVGRITAHTNQPFLDRYHEPVGFFGFFEVVQSIAVAEALLNAAARWVLARGLTRLRGPMNFSLHQECGVLVEGFDTPPMIMMRHDRPYYAPFLEELGFSRAMDFHAFLCEATRVPERLERLATPLQKRLGVRIEPMASSRIHRKRDIETVFRIYNQAWQENWGHVPMTQAEFSTVVKELLPLVEPELILFARKGQETLGFSLGLPDYNQVLSVMRGRMHPWALMKAFRARQTINAVRVMAMGILPEYQGRGIDSLLHLQSFRNGLARGVVRSEFSWVLDNNRPMMNLAAKLGGIRYKTYRITEKDLSTTPISP